MSQQGSPSKNGQGGVIPMQSMQRSNKVHVEEIRQAIPITVRDENYLKAYNENPHGLTKNLDEITETPQDALKRILMEGEVIVSDFDCYFPYKMLPMWKIIMYCILTGGLYLFILLYRMLQRWCYKMKCCTPKVIQFVRGKLAVTNMGRMICWAQEGEQIKEERTLLFDFCCCICKCFCRDTCASPTTFELKIMTKVQTIDAIREISHYYGTMSKFFCCCNDYSFGVKISFNEFDHHRKKMRSFVYTQDTNAYNIFFQAGANIEYFASWLESSLFLASNDVVYLSSTTGDMMHMHDHRSVIEDSAALYARFLDCLPPQPELVVQNPEINGTSKFAYAKEFAGVTMVGDDGSVTLPEKFFHLMQNEKVIATSGQVFTMTNYEWLKCICTLGMYYIFYVRKRKFLRSALVLTNKRVFVLDIYQRSGGIPKTMNNFGLQVTSYFPKFIRSGYLLAEGKYTMQVAIGTLGGGIIFEMYNRERSLPFAKAVQLSSYRLLTTIAVDANKVVSDAPLLTAADKELLPMFGASDRIVDGFAGAFSFKAFCVPNQGVLKYCCDGQAPLCSEQTVGSCVFPWLTHVCTCALRPFQDRQDMYLSENTFFLIKRVGNYGFCGFLSDGKPVRTGCCKKTDSIMISWVALRDVQGHRMIVNSEGRETIIRRCCRKQSCGECCPISHNQLELTVDFPFGSFTISDEKRNHDFSKDEKVRKMVASLDIIEKANYVQTMNRGDMHLFAHVV